MIIIYCPDCGYYSEFENEDIDQLYRVFKGRYAYGLPKEIICGNCKNHGDFSICKIIEE
jgi:Fe2+ or Zn2+ uptake regulation protein